MRSRWVEAVASPGVQAKSFMIGVPLTVVERSVGTLKPSHRPTAAKSKWCHLECIALDDQIIPAINQRLHVENDCACARRHRAFGPRKHEQRRAYK